MNMCTIIISILTSIFSTILLLILLKPKLKIENIRIETFDNKPRIKVKVINKRCCSAAINVRMEVCILQGQYTYHLDVDRENFLILPKRDNRVFQSYDLSKSAKEYYKKGFELFIEEMIKNTDNVIRIRVHATHSFSGFGKAFEERFRYKLPEQFIRINE